MIYCPFCVGQGVIYRAKIANYNMEIFICDECDTVWKDEEINENTSIRFDDFMQSLGLKPLWSEFDKLDEL